MMFTAKTPPSTLLQETAAALLGKEAALFLPSGTQSNLTALLTHCRRGEEYIVGERYHIYAAEAAGAPFWAAFRRIPFRLRL